LPRYLEEAHQIPLVERGQMASLPILVGIVGMLSGGWITDALTRRIGIRWGRALPMALTRFGAMAAYLVVPLLDSPWAIIAAFCAMAAASDLGVPSVWAFMQDVGGRNVGAILGWGNMWGNLGAALSPIILNKIVEANGWDAGFLACAAAYAMAGIAALGVNATILVVRPTVRQTPNAAD
jgi:ACS family glucarate transporter-like MFS transporter